ncbi:TlpA family protein disulfide reductase [Plebeiibacterium sediminum]|uniref:TlpA family protein disulfide reductase n=1 Tax=Plebeiibacterium sediminum TaxID=2992112 RepID=A0AAE3SHI8_9BACT|nr:TlpA disulfide reductase family protein [Plebeiobacterium sediminum]MCW3789643.1 TlpA family protein disulfide reductase [Plebeiobacterium sediminum]
MKSIITIILLFKIACTINAQEVYKNKAQANAERLIKAVNEDDYITYADYFTPEIYPWEDKTNLYDTWNKMLTRDTRIFSDIKLERFGIFNDTQQAYFSLKIGEVDASIIGISLDTGQTWHFTNFITVFNFKDIKERQMHQLDISFADLDVNYNNRVSYEEGESITPFEFTDLQGRTWKSDELKDKIIVLNFWSTSCPPCIKEIPELNKLVDKKSDKDIVFIAVAFHSDKEYILNSFLPKNPFLYNIVLANGNDYQVNSLPTNIIVDTNQKVVGKIIGYSSENISKLKSILDTL